MAIILCLVPWQTAAQNSELTESPFVLVFSELGIPFAADIMNFVVLVAALSGANASLYAATRLLHALGSDRMAPAVAARTSSRGVPVVALLISFTGVVVATVMAVAKIGDIFALLMALVTLCILVVWVMILLTYQAYKKDQKDASSFTCWVAASPQVWLWRVFWRPWRQCSCCPARVFRNRSWSASSSSC